MNLRRITARTAVAGVTAALAAGALVGVSTTTANAATVTNDYVCSLPGLYSGTFPLEVEGSLPAPQYWAGASIPGGLLPVKATATVPADAAALLSGVGVTRARSADFAFKLGSASAPVPVSAAFTTTDGVTTWNGVGNNRAFTTPAPGRYHAVLPKAFTMTAMQGSKDVASLNCVLAPGQTARTLASIQLLKQKSATTAPAKAKVKKGKAAKLRVSVSSKSLGGPVAGKVVAKAGKKTLAKATLKRGKAVLNLGKKLKVGKHKITVTYLGIPSVGASSDRTVLTVKKK